VDVDESLDVHLRALAWRRAFAVAFVQFSAIVYICYLGLIILFFRKREVAFGVLCAVCAVVCFAQPVGVLLALVFGWLRAGPWQIRAFMTVWTVLVVMATLNLTAAIVLLQLDTATLRQLFGEP
jgi:hypothetical protein